jgi:hypothetical protein
MFSYLPFLVSTRRFALHFRFADSITPGTMAMSQSSLARSPLDPQHQPDPPPAVVDSEVNLQSERFDVSC